MHGRLFCLNRKNLFNADAEENIDILIKELTKARYCDVMLRASPYSKYELEKRMKTLRKLEAMNPELQYPYSPTQYEGFSNEYAVEAFGEWDWSTLKSTLNFAMPFEDYGFGEG